MKNVPKVAAAILAGIALASASLVRADVDPAVLKAEQQRIAALKQIHRNLPQTFYLEQYPTPEDLKAAWPVQLPQA